MTEDEVKKWLKSRRITTYYNTVFEKTLPLECSLGQDGRVNIPHRLLVQRSNLTGIPFKFGVMTEEFSMEDCQVDDLSFIPTTIVRSSGQRRKTQFNLSGVWQPAKEISRVLFMEVEEVIFNDMNDREDLAWEIEKLLNSNRKKGVMDRAVIPAKMKKLKGLLNDA